jgi:hypothetical protein
MTKVNLILFVVKGTGKKIPRRVGYCFLCGVETQTLGPGGAPPAGPLGESVAGAI